MNRMRKLFIFLLLINVVFIASAQASISVQVPTVVSIGEQFNLTFKIEGDKVKDFNWPGSNDFDINWGPQTGTSSQTTIINGKVSKSVSTSYTYVLMAKTEGVFTLPACSAKVKGNSISSQPITIKVVKGSVPNSASSSSGDVSGEDLFMRLQVDKRKVVLGEPITATLKLYSRVSIAGFEDVKFPSFDGFWSQAIYNPTNVEFQRESIGEEVYEVAILRTYKLIPQKIGDLVIDPAEMVCQVQVRNRSASTGNPFDSFFQNDYNIIRKRVRTKSVTLSVEDLPKPQPSSYCGGVGKFSMAVQLSRDSVRMHDAASLIVKIKGEGNLNLLEAPKIKFPPEFEVYDVKSSDENGMRVFEYPFIARHYGNYSLGPVEFSYYDIESKSYKTLSSTSLSLVVEKGADSDISSTTNVVISNGGKDVKNLGVDIRYIAVNTSKLKPIGKHFVFSLTFFVLLTIILLVAIIVFSVVKITRKEQEDIVGARKRGASKLAKKKLSIAESYLKQGLSGAFYEELHKALLGFVADKYTLEVSDLDKESIYNLLEKEGVSKEMASEYISLIDACEYARYAPDNQDQQMNMHYQKALDIISALGKKQKNGSENKLVSFLAFLLLCVPSLKAQDWGSACDKYADGNYAEAYAIWHSIEDSGNVSPELYYNLGCASYKCSNIAEAVLYFERALKLDPSYSDARHNLEFVSQFLQDRVDSVPEFFFVSWIKSARNIFSSDVWTAISLVMFAVLLFGICGLLLFDGKKPKIISFVISILAFLLLLWSFFCSVSLKNVSEDESHAVVMSAVSVVRSSPDDKSGVDLFILHEGTKSHILEEVGEWYKIELSDGRQGWAPKSDLEVI